MRQGALEERRGTWDWRRARGSADWQLRDDEVVLRPGDSLRTGADGHVRLRMRTGASWSWGPKQSSMLSSDTENYAELLIGKIRCWVMRYSRKFEVRTPTAVLAVRGTEFALKASPGTATELTAIDGKVVFTALPGTTEASRQAAWWAVGRLKRNPPHCRPTPWRASAQDQHG